MTVSGKTDFDHIFRAYDIRGIFGEDLTEEVATRIGAAFAHFLEGKNIVVGRDVRISGDKLRDALVSGLISKCDITDVGVVPTPLLYFAATQLQKNAGIMVTASHNPPKWNGFKAFRGQKGSIYGKDMETIRDIAKDVDINKLGKKLGKSVSYHGIIGEYQDFVQNKICIEKKLNVVTDSANDGVVRLDRFGIPDDFVKPLVATVQVMFAIVLGEHVGFAVEFKTAVGDAIAIPADRRSKVRTRKLHSPPCRDNSASRSRVCHLCQGIQSSS